MGKNFFIKYIGWKSCVVVVGFLLAAVTMAGCSGGEPDWLPGSEKITPDSVSVIQDTSEETPPGVISVEGIVVPVKHVALSFSGVGGVIDEVLVEEGDRVQVGQVLARLTGRERLQSTVAAAETELLAAQQALDALYDHHGLRLAETQQAIARADKALDNANDRVENLLTSADPADVDAAHAEMIVAKDKLTKANDKYEPYKKKNDDNVIRAMLEAQVASAQKKYDATVTRYNNLLGGTNQMELAIAEADIAVAQATLDKANKDFADLQGGPPADEVDMAQSRIRAAEAQLTAAKAALEDAELTAPFAGIIVSLDIKPGQVVNVTDVAIQLADLDHWQVETTDLEEGDLRFVDVGMPARITLDAFPEQEFRGVVRAIDLLGVESRGTATYSVLVDFDPGETAVRWLMTSFVDIEHP